MTGRAEPQYSATAPRRWALALLMCTIFSIAGCASFTRPVERFGSQEGGEPAATAEIPPRQWSGRLALKVDGPTPQSFTAAFELTGDAQTGQLTLSTPLGSTLAQLNWTPAGASLQSPRERRVFPSLDAMIAHVTGASVPAQALFDWLQGKSTVSAGWSADLSQRAQGRIVARQPRPPQPSELRIVLDR